MKIQSRIADWYAAFVSQMESVVVNPIIIAEKDYPQRVVINIIAAHQKGLKDVGNAPIPLVIKICLPLIKLR